MPNRNLAEQFINDDGTVVNGFMHVEYPANPTAGNAFVRAVDGVGLRRLRSLIATFTTSAAAANRFVQLNVVDGDNKTLYSASFLTAITASLTTTVSAYNGVTPQTSLVNATALINVPPFYLLIGMKLQLTATAIDVADAFTNIRLVWEVVPLGVGGIDQEAN